MPVSVAVSYEGLSSELEAILRDSGDLTPDITEVGIPVDTAKTAEDYSFESTHDGIYFEKRAFIVDNANSVDLLAIMTAADDGLMEKTAVGGVSNLGGYRMTLGVPIAHLGVTDKAGPMKNIGPNEQITEGHEMMRRARSDAGISTADDIVEAQKPEVLSKRDRLLKIFDVDV